MRAPSTGFLHRARRRNGYALLPCDPRRRRHRGFITRQFITPVSGHRSHSLVTMLMPTEPLFRDDPYLKSATARVTAIQPGGVELDRTIFYPQGGGQAGDTGVLIRANGERITVTDTRKGER